MVTKCSRPPKLGALSLQCLTHFYKADLWKNKQILCLDILSKGGGVHWLKNYEYPRMLSTIHSFIRQIVMCISFAVDHKVGAGILQ